MRVGFLVIFAKVNLEMIGDQYLVTDLQRASAGRTTHNQLPLQRHDAGEKP